jgi:nucleoside-diphosphate-sugar epimerase
MDTVKVMPAWMRRNRPIGLQSRHYRPLPRLFRRRRLLIIGCGDIGQRIASLCTPHWRVYGLARSTATLARVRSAGAIPLDAAVPHRRFQDLADWVVHSAPPPAEDAGVSGCDIDRLTRRWSARLLKRRPQAAPRGDAGNRVAARRRLVYLSTTGVYGDRQGRWTDETTAVRPMTARARAMSSAVSRRDGGRHP